jgi:hypothetical protein
MSNKKKLEDYAKKLSKFINGKNLDKIELVISYTEQHYSNVKLHFDDGTYIIIGPEVQCDPQWNGMSVYVEAFEKEN